MIRLPRTIRVLVCLAAGCAIAVSSAGCSIEDRPPARDSRGSGFGAELLAARELGLFLDDLTGPASEAVITSNAGFVEEIERQAVVDHRQANMIAMDRSAVVTVQAIRFRNAGFGRALMTPKGIRDPSPPDLPRGAVATIGELRSDYAERAAIVSKGPTFVRLEVISTDDRARTTSRRLLERAARLQFDKLVRHASSPGTTFDTAHLKYRLALGEVGTVLVLLLVVTLITAVFDRASWQSARNLLRGRPSPPPHAVDVDARARAIRRSHARRGLLRATFALAILVAVSLLPLGLVRAAAVLVGAVVAWDLGARLLAHSRDRGSARWYSRGDLLIVGLASALSLALAAAAVFVIWFGIVTELVGAPGLGNGDLERFRTTCLLVGAGLLVLSRAPLGIGRRLAMRRLARRVRADTRPEVLLLRSFADDRLKIRVRGLRRSGIDRIALRRWERFEESLAHGLFEVGPVEAVGEPGEYLPPLGAARTYYPETEWQEGVSRRIQSAALVVLCVGRTAAVSWEVSQVRAHDALDATVFVIPPVAALERRARLHTLAELLEIDARLLDHEEPGIEILAVAVPDGRNPVLLTSGTRDDASYDLAIQTALGALGGEIDTRGPVAARRATPQLPRPLIIPPGHAPRPRSRLRRPAYVVLAVAGGWLLFAWGFLHTETTDNFREIVDLPSTTRFLVPVEGADVVIAVGNLDTGVRVTEVDPARGSARIVATLETSPTSGSAEREWIVLTSARQDTVSGVNRRTGRTWTTRIPGAPQGSAISANTTLVALTEGDAVAELRLDDGRLLRRIPVSGAPFDVSTGGQSPLVSLANSDRVVSLSGGSSPAGRSFALRSPRNVFVTGREIWGVSAADGSLRRLEPPAKPGIGLRTSEFLPVVAASSRYLVAASRETGVITVGDTRTGRVVRRFHSPLEVQAIAVTDVGKVITALKGYRDLGVYDIHQPRT